MQIMHKIQILFLGISVIISLPAMEHKHHFNQQQKSPITQHLESIQTIDIPKEKFIQASQTINTLLQEGNILRLLVNINAQEGEVNFLIQKIKQKIVQSCENKKFRVIYFLNPECNNYQEIVDETKKIASEEQNLFNQQNQSSLTISADCLQRIAMLTTQPIEAIHLVYLKK